MTAASTEVAVGKSAVAVKGQCDKQTALTLTREVKRSVEQCWRLLKEAFERRTWAALGYDAWDSCCPKELGTGLVRLSTQLRREAVAELTGGETPMSNRAIASALRGSEGTVRTHLTAGAQSRAPDPECDVAGASVMVEAQAAGAEVVPAEVVKVEVVEVEVVEVEVVAVEVCEKRVREVLPVASVRRIAGADGKSYPTRPAARRRRRPLPDAFCQAVRTINPAAQRLTSLIEEDRFSAHPATLGGRGDLQRVADALGTVLEALAEAGDAE